MPKEGGGGRSSGGGGRKGRERFNGGGGGPGPMTPEAAEGADEAAWRPHCQSCHDES